MAEKIWTVTGEQPLHLNGRRWNIIDIYVDQFGKTALLLESTQGARHRCIVDNDLNMLSEYVMCGFGDLPKDWGKA